MRGLLILSLLLGSAGCDFGRSTGPVATVIRVRLLDDKASSAGRNQVLVTLGTGDRIDAHTAADGTVDIRVPGSGMYQIRVIPRDGYISTADLSKTVTLAQNETALFNFTVHRAGWKDDPIEPVGH